MSGPAYRLGDLIDDFCPRCRLLLNHAIASMVEDKVVKVICHTCYSEHPYRHGESGKKKKPAHGRAALFDQVLSKSARASATPPPPPDDPPAPSAADPQKKPPEIVARYISRHKSKPPKKRT